MCIRDRDKAYDLWAENDDFEAVFVATDGTVYITDGLKDVYKRQRVF